MSTYVKQSLTLLASHLSVCIAEDETNCGEEVTLARAIATDDNIVFGREGLDDRLVLVAMEEVSDVPQVNSEEHTS